MNTSALSIKELIEFRTSMVTRSELIAWMVLGSVTVTPALVLGIMVMVISMVKNIVDGEYRWFLCSVAGKFTNLENNSGSRQRLKQSFSINTIVYCLCSLLITDFLPYLYIFISHTVFSKIEAPLWFILKNRSPPQHNRSHYIGTV